MSKTKASGLIHYEILFIIPNKFTDEEAQTVFKKVAELIQSHEGKISHEEYWGKKKFAYPINHEYYGYYGLYEFDIERSTISTINNTLRLDKEILRSMIVKKDVKSAEQIKKDAKIQEKIEKRKQDIIKEEEKETETKKKKSEERKEDKKEKKADKKEDKKEDKVDLNKLDEKLDDVLNIDNLL